MKSKRSISFAIILFSLCYGLITHAKDSASVADQIETPDVLLQDSAPKNKKVKYGDTDISISPKGKKDNALVSPDPLEKHIENKSEKQEDQDVSKEPEKIKNQIKKPHKKSEPNQNIETPDPLLDF